MTIYSLIWGIFKFFSLRIFRFLIPRSRNVENDNNIEKEITQKESNGGWCAGYEFVVRYLVRAVPNTVA